MTNDQFIFVLAGVRKIKKLALQWSNPPIDIETDSLEAVNMMRCGDTNRSKYALLIREIRDSMPGGSFCITHIRRSGNSSIHVLANIGRTQG